MKKTHYLCRMKEIDPKQTNRARAFELWMKSPMPMVTFLKTLNITPLMRVARKRGLKLNMLLCYCIGRAASRTPEFYILPVGEKLMQFEHLAVNTIVRTLSGSINTCDIPFSDDLATFNADYLRLTHEATRREEPLDLGEEYMVIGTSALTKCDLDGVVNIYAGSFNNPFLAWGRYRRGWFKTLLPISFQFHHTQMDGPQSTGFLNTLQAVIEEMR